MGVTACMATFPPRHRTLAKTVASLIDQVDHLQVYANQYTEYALPKCLSAHKITTLLGEDLGDNGKVEDLPHKGYVFLVDDDIIYPPNYVEMMIAALGRYDNNAVVGCHAAIMQPPIRNYFKDRRVFHFRSLIARDTPVNVLGTGCLAFHTDYIDFDISDSPCPNMLDVHFAVWCQKNQKKMITLARPPEWLIPQPVPESLWSTRGEGEEQTSYINTVSKWKIY